MRISLIGMSNIGKTSFAKRLATHGFSHIDCDALIQKKLEDQGTVLPSATLGGVAEWMGFPSLPRYQANSALYLSCEQQVLREALDFLDKNQNASAVIDTTGSVVYLDKALLEALRNATRVVYLEASEEQIQKLFAYFHAHPKPLIWGDCYQPGDGETPEQTLKRCYPALLRSRADKYKELAHVTIPVEDVIKHMHNLDVFLQEKLAWP